MIQKLIQKNKGFTILETLVAISIILIAITGPIDIIGQALKNSYYSRDQITAFYLAQEAIEYARNQRDDNALARVPIANWLNGVTGEDAVGCLNNAGTAELALSKCVLVQDSSGTYHLKDLLVGSNDVMKKSSDEGAYGILTGTIDTNFSREIYFTRVPNVDDPDTDKNLDPLLDETDATGVTNYKEVVMTVKVTWRNSFGSDNKFVINERLFNWKLRN